MNTNTPTPEERAAAVMMGGYKFDREAAIAAAIREAEDAAYERAAIAVAPEFGPGAAETVRRMKGSAAGSTGGG